MVATSGKWSGGEWRLAPSLVALWQQANAIAPNRSRRSDGSIGDRAHQARKSDHNPQESGKVDWVDGIDITHDPDGGLDIHAWARQMAARREPRLDYVISNRWIWSRRTGRWSRYTGPNPHTAHAHFSVHDGGRFDTSSWFDGVPIFSTPVDREPPPPPAPRPIEVPDMFLAQSPQFGQRFVFIEGSTIIDIGAQQGADAKGLPVVPLSPEQLDKLRQAFTRSVVL